LLIAPPGEFQGRLATASNPQIKRYVTPIERRETVKRSFQHVYMPWRQVIRSNGMKRHHRQGFIGIILCIMMIISAGATTVAAEAKYKLKFVGISRAVDTWPYWEKWAKSVNEKTDGQVEIELVSLPELGFSGVELIKPRDHGRSGGGLGPSQRLYRHVQAGAGNHAKSISCKWRDQRTSNTSLPLR
jgi:hypothetical protein